MSEPGKKSLLVVDDEVGVREFVAEILDGSEYQCTLAPGFPEAVDIASAPDSQIDILLTDIILPPFHGRDLANRLVHLQPRMKVLFMSGYPLKMLKEYGLLPPKTEYLSKPFTRSQLLKSLDDISTLGPTWSMVTTVDAEEG